MKTEQRLIKYISRMYAKTSPFSTFTNLVMAKLDVNKIESHKENDLWNIDESLDTNTVSPIRLNNFLYQYIKGLLTANRDIYRWLPVRPNPTLRKEKQHYVFLTNSHNVEAFQRLAWTPVLDLFLQVGRNRKEGVLFDDMVNTTIASGAVDATPEEIASYLDNLIAYGFLEFDLGVSGTDPDWDLKLRDQLRPLVFMQAVHPGRHTLEEMARWTPTAITAWRFGRLLKAGSWHVHLLVSWLAQDLLAILPAPAHGILSLFGDGSHADTRGAKHPVAQQGRNSTHHPGFFGLRFVLLMAAWNGSRLPGGFRRILPKHHAGDRSDNALFREMVSAFVPPPWATLVVVGGDAAYGSQATMCMGQERDTADTARPWGVVFAIARTWKTVEEKTLKHLVTHLPRKYYRRIRVPRKTAGRGRRTFWTYSRTKEI